MVDGKRDLEVVSGRDAIGVMIDLWDEMVYHFPLDDGKMNWMSLQEEILTSWGLACMHNCPLCEFHQMMPDCPLAAKGRVSCSLGCITNGHNDSMSFGDAKAFLKFLRSKYMELYGQEYVSEGGVV